MQPISNFMLRLIEIKINNTKISKKIQKIIIVKSSCLKLAVNLDEKIR
jgi:hypothetical protein